MHNNLPGLRIAPGVKHINHAQFADDTQLMGGASMPTTKKFKKELDAYTQISGSVISLTKSKIFGWNITPREMLYISRVLGMEGCTTWDAFKYLGVPIFKYKPKSSHWAQLIEKTKKQNKFLGIKLFKPCGQSGPHQSSASKHPNIPKLLSFGLDDYNP
jgi:hypothetical protein